MSDESKALVPWQPAPALTYRERAAFALAAAQSKMYTGLEVSKDGQAKALVKIQMGAEMGLGPAASLRNIYVTENGTIGLSAALISAKIKQSRPRYNYRVKSTTDEACTVTFFEDGEEVGEASFTMEEAKRAGLPVNNPKSGWAKYPAAMLFARALTKGARLYTPDLLMGIAIYTAEEIGGPDQPPDEIADAEFTVTTPKVSAEEVAELQQLASKAQVDVAKFLAYYKVADWSELTVEQYRHAKNNLSARSL